MVIAQITDKRPRFLKITMGDAHLYQDHFQQAELQVARLPYALPKLCLPPIHTLSELENSQAADFVLEDYKSHPAIKAPMSV